MAGRHSHGICHLWLAFGPNGPRGWPSTPLMLHHSRLSDRSRDGLPKPTKHRRRSRTATKTGGWDLRPPTPFAMRDLLVIVASWLPIATARELAQRWRLLMVGETCGAVAASKRNLPVNKESCCPLTRCKHEAN